VLELPDVLPQLQGRRQRGALQKVDYRSAARVLGEHPVSEQRAQFSVELRTPEVESDLIQSREAP
jgi:hypothetical protein